MTPYASFQQIENTMRGYKYLKISHSTKKKLGWKNSLEKVVRKRTRKQPSVIARPLFLKLFALKNKKKNKKKKADWRPFWIFFSVKFVMGYPCVRHYTVLYSWSSHFAFLELSKYYKIQNGRWSQKFIRSLADIAEQFYQIKRISDGNFFLKCANEHVFVSNHSNWRVDDMGIKMSPKQFPSGMLWLCEVWGSRSW